MSLLGKYVEFKRQFLGISPGLYKIIEEWLKYDPEYRLRKVSSITLDNNQVKIELSEEKSFIPVRYVEHRKTWSVPITIKTQKGLRKIALGD